MYVARHYMYIPKCRIFKVGQPISSQNNEVINEGSYIIVFNEREEFEIVCDSSYISIIDLSK